ncbi:hypothetical protein LX59_03025 [Azomonas agilis]|uniref:Uncharacterized protein n=1 Tax=Azomonas agilis TaxID=116849 RepID=A0A562HYN7_9GAMM|nr:hypothetical protein [Azomonas agilis]TWH63861.1 hypothetical protein LX59_03025 [Azomonas agilis]
MTSFTAKSIGQLLAEIERHTEAHRKTIIWIRQPMRTKGRWVCRVRLEAV